MKYVIGAILMLVGGVFVWTHFTFEQALGINCLVIGWHVWMSGE